MYLENIQINEEDEYLIYITDDAKLWPNKCNLYADPAPRGRGGIQVTEFASLNVKDSEFVTMGSAVLLRADAKKVIITDCVFKNCGLPITIWQDENPTPNVRLVFEGNIFESDKQPYSTVICGVGPHADATMI